MPKEGTASAAKRIGVRLANEMGYEFIDAELHKEHGSVFLRIFIDHADGLDLDRCAAYHRRLNSLVDHLPYDYLEVSSPGLDRPLKTEADYAKHVGKQIAIKLYRALNGKKEYIGELTALEDVEVVLSVDGQAVRIPQKDCALVKPVIDMTMTDNDEENRT